MRHCFLSILTILFFVAPLGAASNQTTQNSSGKPLGIESNVNIENVSDDLSKKNFKKLYWSTKNTFLKSLKYRDEQESINKELKNIKKQLKKYTQIGDMLRIQELNDDLHLLESKLKIADQKYQDLYLKVTTISAINAPMNILNFISKQPLKDADKAIHTLVKLRQEHAYALVFLKRYLKEVKNKMSQSADKKEAKQYKLLYKSMILDQRYLRSFTELIEKQYEHLLEQRSNTENRYYEYRDNELLRHLFTLVVIFILFLIAYILKRLTLHYVKEDEQQFIYRRTISTTVIVIGLIFLTITYSENLIYSLTIFTFIGAAIVIATRQFLLNIIAWINLSISHFVKVGDRVLIPHETKYYYGDIINISPVRMTIYEAYDFSSTREAVNAGRIIFIPNSYIFSHAIMSYSHQSQKTIFDNVSFNFKFDTDITKVENLTKEVLKDQTGHFMPEAEKQFNKLRKRYDVKQRMLSPEIQFVINSASTAVKMTAWYITPSHEATQVKNAVIALLIKKFSEDKDIQFNRTTKTTKASGDDSES